MRLGCQAPELHPAFLLLNINGRAGRYLKHFVGNIVYLNKDTAKIESSETISLDLKLFSDDILIDDIDLENVQHDDLSAKLLSKIQDEKEGTATEIAKWFI